MLSHDNVNYVAVAVFLNTLKQGVAASLWLCNLFEWQWASVKYRQVFMFQFLICSSCAFCDCVREGIPHFLEGEQQERVMSYLPLSHIAGMAVDITMWHPQKFFKSSVSPCPVMDRFFVKSAEAHGNHSSKLQSCNLAQFFRQNFWSHGTWVGLEVTCYFARPYDMKAGSLKDRLCACRPTLMLAVPLVWEKSLCPKFFSKRGFMCYSCGICDFFLNLGQSTGAKASAWNRPSFWWSLQNHSNPGLLTDSEHWVQPTQVRWKGFKTSNVFFFRNLSPLSCFREGWSRASPPGQKILACKDPRPVWWEARKLSSRLQKHRNFVKFFWNMKLWRVGSVPTYQTS